MDFELNYEFYKIGNSTIIRADCLEWLERLPENVLHGIVTDPPYGIKEFEPDQLEKRLNGKGGIWRLPPVFDNNIRSPLPRFTALNNKERKAILDFFTIWGRLTLHALRPGAHVIIATNAFISQLLYSALVTSGLEFRGQIIRLVRTLRGGDRPKNAEKEFPEISSLPRGCYEPWGLFRKPIPNGMTVSDCLRNFQTGGLRRISPDKPFEDVILSERTSRREKEIANHPSLKPQSLMRRLVCAVLPLGNGIIADPFMGAGSTIAAAEALKISAVGVEKNSEFFNMAKQAIPKLKNLPKSELKKQLNNENYRQKRLFKWTI